MAAGSAGREGLVDQHSYGVLDAELGLGTFETQLAAAAGGARPHGGSWFDSGLGLAVRRWCPPLLGLEEHCTPVRYLARRRELGAYTAGRRLLRGSGIGCFVVDTAARHDLVGAPQRLPEQPGLSSPYELAAAAGAGARVRETVCLESLACQVADTSGAVRSFVTNTAEALYAAARDAAAFVCVGGFHEAGPPALPEVYRAAERWLAARARRVPGPRRGDPLEPGPPVPPHSLRAEPALVRHLVWSALVTGRPVQLRCGDPAPLEGFLRESTGPGTAVVLLPSRPYHRAAARLAAAHPHVYTDAGPRPAETLAEAPFGKLLFTSGARALPELYVVRARSFVRALGKLLAGWVAEGGCSRADAVRIADQLTGGTARRLYRLEGDASGAVAGGPESAG